MFEPFLERNMIPIIAGRSWNADKIGYARAIDVANISSPCISSYADVIDGTRKEKDKPIANNQTFLETNLSIGFKE